MVEDTRLIPIMAGIDIPAGPITNIVSALTKALVLFCKDKKQVSGRKITIQVDFGSWMELAPRIGKSDNPEVSFPGGNIVQLTIHIHNYVMLMQRLGSKVIYTEVSILGQSDI